MSKAPENLLITVSGLDKPGITASLTNLIAQNEGEILDIGQSVIHDFLSLSILVKLKAKTQLLKDILFEGRKMGLSVEFMPIERSSFEEKKKKQSYIISSVHSRGLPSDFVSELTGLLASKNLNIQSIRKTSETFKSLDIICDGDSSFSWDRFKKDLISLSHQYQTDTAFQKNNVFRWNKRLIVFDMDSTLIQTEVVNQIAELAGEGERVAQITERAMNGELDFKESLRERVALFEGLPVEDLQEIAKNLPITEGVPELIKTVKKLGYKLAIISGGFTYFAHFLKEKLGMDYAFANELEILHGKLTGKVLGTIVDSEQKAILLDLMAQQESISLEQTVAIGDGANDLPMLSKAGFGIAFHAKPYVRERAKQQVSHNSMESLLHFLGISDDFF